MLETPNRPSTEAADADVCGPGIGGPAGEEEPQSIRGYRARKLRPCDNCRSRRKRCLIPEVGQACGLCVQTRKECTFLRGRPRARSSIAPTMNGGERARDGTEDTRSDDEDMDAGQHPSGPSAPIHLPPQATSKQLSDLSPHTISPRQVWSAPVPAPANAAPLTAVPPIPISSSQHPQLPGLDSSLMSSSTNTLLLEPQRSRAASTVAILGRIRSAPQPQSLPLIHPHSSSSSGQSQSHVALDDEAAHDEELYLVGTASERDALILNNLTMGVVESSPGSTDIPGLRLRIVSPNVSFVFYKSLPYGSDGSGGSSWRQVESLVGSMVASETVEKFFEIEGQGLPIFNPIAHFHLPDILRSFCLSAGLIYVPSLRHLHRSVYMIAMAAMRREAPRARLWTMQSYLLDLNGREAINPSGNFVVLGLAVSVARLLGLHEDCAGWTIPGWEKVVRTRLWWALLSYDKLSSLTFGRPRTIHDGAHVPLPSRGRNPSPSIDAFISLCELTSVLDSLPASPATSSGLHTPSSSGAIPHEQIWDQVSIAAVKLDEWRSAVDSRGLFAHTAAPGVQSLHLIYLGARLMVVRALWDALAAGSGSGGAGERAAQQQQQQQHGLVQAAACQEGCLQTCQEIVDFVCGLSPRDLNGYWSSHCPFILSFCLTLLVRLIMASDRTDQSDDAIWQAALFALRRFISVLAGYHDTAHWDIARLVLSRARYFIPLLARQAAELQIALWPLQEELGGEPPHEQSIDDFINSIFNPIGL